MARQWRCPAGKKDWAPYSDDMCKACLVPDVNVILLGNAGTEYLQALIEDREVTWGPSHDSKKPTDKIVKAWWQGQWCWVGRINNSDKETKNDSVRVCLWRRSLLHSTVEKFLVMTAPNVEAKTKTLLLIEKSDPDSQAPPDSSPFDQADVVVILILEGDVDYRLDVTYSDLRSRPKAMAKIRKDQDAQAGRWVTWEKFDKHVYVASVETIRGVRPWRVIDPLRGLLGANPWHIKSFLNYGLRILACLGIVILILCLGSGLYLNWQIHDFRQNLSQAKNVEDVDKLGRRLQEMTLYNAILRLEMVGDLRKEVDQQRKIIRDRDELQKWTKLANDREYEHLRKILAQSLPQRQVQIRDVVRPIIQGDLRALLIKLIAWKSDAPPAPSIEIAVTANEQIGLLFPDEPWPAAALLVCRSAMMMQKLAASHLVKLKDMEGLLEALSRTEIHVQEECFVEIVEELARQREALSVQFVSEAIALTDKLPVDPRILSRTVDQLSKTLDLVRKLSIDGEKVLYSRLRLLEVAQAMSEGRAAESLRILNSPESASLDEDPRYSALRHQCELAADDMVFVPSGKYVVGRPDAAQGESFSPAGTRTVVAFYISRNELTDTELQEGMANITSGSANTPLLGYDDAISLANYKAADIPTEQEWEAAAIGRYGAGSRPVIFPTTGRFDQDGHWRESITTKPETRPVNLIGGRWEFVRSSPDSQILLKGCASEVARLCWLTAPECCGITFRLKVNREMKSPTFGLRLVTRLPKTIAGWEPSNDR